MGTDDDRVTGAPCGLQSLNGASGYKRFGDIYGGDHQETLAAAYVLASRLGGSKLVALVTDDQTKHVARAIVHERDPDAPDTTRSTHPCSPLGSEDPLIRSLLRSAFTGRIGARSDRIARIECAAGRHRRLRP